MNEDKNVVLSVRNVSKCFEMYDKPRHRLYQTLCAGRKKFYKEFWALRDISFDVHRGECVGIIGRNGAGKSTLLQIVTGTLSPTSGAVESRGRVAALLELGSGFNPDFTGRENVYLNGTILGLTKREIDARYDEIAAFADIGDFIDQPVKTYSSGMMVRLAFAVNVFVDPDVLIVDEALAVGDIGFQMRCFQRLRELIWNGTTILFVTHDLASVSGFCQKVLFLQDGQQVAYSDDVIGTIGKYKKSMRVVERKAEDSAERNQEVSEFRFGSHEATIEKCEICSLENAAEDLSALVAGRRYRLMISIKAKKDLPCVVMGIALRDREGLDIWGENTMRAFPLGFHLKVGDNKLVFETPFNVNVGDYGVTVGIADVSTNPRKELDQRWPLRTVSVISDTPCPGRCFAPWNFVSQS